MRDSDVREAMRSWLASEYADDPSSRFVEEMGVWNGSVRIDLAVINGALHGYEIKSERDTLGRLSEQMRLYDQVFDTITLVAAEKHISKARPLVSPWWGLTVVAPGADGKLTLTEAKKAEQNPLLDKVQLARLLWKPEQLLVLEKIGKGKGARSKSVDALCEILANALSERALSAHVREMLKARSGWLRQAVTHERQVAAGAN
jgi:hypothetical protein